MNILVSKSSFELSNLTLVLKSFSLAYLLTSDPVTFKIDFEVSIFSTERSWF
jgi:hypothetical protein